MMKTSFLATLILALAASACGDSLDVKNTDPKGDVGGVVVDAVTRMPIEGATVTVIAGADVSDPETTGADGTFSVSGVSAGEVIIMIDGPEGAGYQSVWINEFLNDEAGEFPSSGTITVGPIGLISGTDELTVRVLDEQGRPVSMYTLTLRHFVQYLDLAGGISNNQGEVVMAATTGTDGRATFTGLPPLFQLSPNINPTALLTLPPVDDGGVFSYPGGSQTLNLRAYADATPDVVLDPNYDATLQIRGSNIADLYDPPGSGNTASMLSINDVAHVNFNLPIQNTATVVVMDEAGTPIENQPTVTVSDDNITMSFGNNPLVPGNEYNIFIHAVAAVGDAGIAGDFGGSFFTPGLEDNVMVTNVTRDATTQVVDVEFSEPIGIGGNSSITLSGSANCVLFFNYNLNGMDGIGDATNERGNPNCSITFSSAEPDPPGIVGASGYTKFWQFTAPMDSTPAPLPSGTRFDIVFSRVSNSNLIVERPDGRVVRDFVTPNDIPIP